jgi:molybdate transport system regulatory protein
MLPSGLRSAMQAILGSTIHAFRKETVMKPGARNQLTGKVTSIKSDEIMSLVKFSVAVPKEMASVLTTESVKDMDLKIGDEVELVIKAIHVLPLKR